MSKPTWPGDLSDGDAATAASVNDRTKPLFQQLDPDMTGGTGIDDDNVPPGNLSANRINGVAVTRNADETITGDKTITGNTQFDGAADHNGRIRGNSTPREFGAFSSGANGGSATNDQSPDVSGINLVELNYNASTDIEQLDNGVIGQRVILYIIAGSNQVTLKANTGGAVNGKIQTPGAHDIILRPGFSGTTPHAIAIELVCVKFDNEDFAWLPLGVTRDS